MPRAALTAALGAYGKAPSDEKTPSYKPDAPLSQQFANPVHCVRLSGDGLVYVCDRANDRIQVFRKDGTFVTEFRSSADARQRSVWDLALSHDPQQRYIFVVDGANNQVIVLARADGTVAVQIQPARTDGRTIQWVHNVAIDSKGNLYTARSAGAGGRKSSTGSIDRAGRFPIPRRRRVG